MDILTYALCNKKIKNVEDMVDSLERLTFVIVDEIPTIATAEPNKLYLVDTNHDGMYEEYIMADIDGESTIVELGPVVDLSGYYDKIQIDSLLLTKQNVLSWDNTIAANGANPVVSGVIYSAISKLINDVTQLENGNLQLTTVDGTTSVIQTDTTVTNTNKLVQGRAVYAAIQQLEQAMAGIHIELTQAQYDALQTVDPNVEYFITDAVAEGDFSELEDRVGDLETSNQSAVHYKGTTTTAIENGSTTNPIVIDGEEYTAVFGDIVMYGYTEFVFDGTTWSEFGRPFDTTPTSGSANAVTSDGIYALIRSGTGVQSVCTGNMGNVASGLGSTAMGIGSRATTRGAFATGEYTIAAGQSSFATGFYSKTTNANQFSCGMYNNSRNGDLFNVGNGTTNSRSNIVEVNRTEMNVNGDIKCNGVSLPTPYTTMPTITEAMLGQIAQYVGTTDANYTKGWFYEAKSNGAAEPTYYWAKIGDERTETVLWENTGTTNPDTITLSEAYTNFDELVIVHANDRPAFSETTIHTSTIAIGDIYVLWLYSGTIYATYAATSSTVFTKTSAAGVYTIREIIGIKYGSNGGSTDDYTTTERKIGEWIDGSDLYQRTFEVTGLTESDSWVFNNNILGTSDIDIKDFSGYTEWSDGTDTTRFDLNFYLSGSIHSLCLNAISDLAISLNHESTSFVKAIITIKYTKISAQANLMQVSAPTEEVSETPTVEEQEEVPETPIEDDMR